MTGRWHPRAALLIIFTMFFLLYCRAPINSEEIEIPAQELGKLGLDDVSTLATVIETDTTEKVEGEGAIKITTKWPTTICLGEFLGIKVENTRLVCRASIKCENLQGSAFIEMWCTVGGGNYFSRGMDTAVGSTTGWQIVEVPFMLYQDQQATGVLLNLVITGKGTVWIDDVRLIQQPWKE